MAQDSRVLVRENLSKSVAQLLLCFKPSSPAGQSLNEDQTLYISFSTTESALSYSILKPC